MTLKEAASWICQNRQSFRYEDVLDVIQSVLIDALEERDEEWYNGVDAIKEDLWHQIRNKKKEKES